MSGLRVYGIGIHEDESRWYRMRIEAILEDSELSNRGARLDFELCLPGDSGSVSEIEKRALEKARKLLKTLL